MAKLSLVLFLVLLSACGKSSNPTGKGNSDAGLHNDEITGPLIDEVKKIQAGKFSDACDLRDQYKAKQLEIAAALDQRTEAITEFSNGLPPGEDWKRDILGPIQVRVPNKVFTAKPGWAEFRYGWKEILERYRKIKDSPMGREWVNLNSQVRSILVDEKSRVLYGFNMQLGKDSGPGAIALSHALTGCLKKTECVYPELNPVALEFIKNQPVHQKLQKALLDATDGNDKRAALKQWQEAGGEDASGYLFRKNSKVSRLSADTLTLVLDPGAFADAKEALAQYIEPVWHSSQLKLKIDWQVRESGAVNPFKFIAEMASGGRSFVRYTDNHNIVNEVHLFNGVRVTSIAHELGHVLGFKDHYYTTWDSVSCEYVEQNTQEDLMSDSVFTQVTAEEWAELDKNYPLAKDLN